MAWMMTNVYYFSCSSIPLVSHCDFGHTAPPAPAEQYRTSLTKLPKYLGNSCSGVYDCVECSVSTAGRCNYNNTLMIEQPITRDCKTKGDFLSLFSKKFAS